MYFSDEEHRKNYETLLFRYKIFKRENIEYKATVYIAAFPDIFKFLDLDKVSDDESALHQLVDWNDDGILIITEAGLTAGTSALVRLGINLFNGTEFNLARAIDSASSSTYQSTLLQAIKIRMNIK